MNIGIAGLKQVGHRGIFLAKKFAPEILTGVGIVGVVTAAVLGAKATLKLEETIDSNSALVEVTRLNQLDGKSTERDVVMATTHGYVKIGQLYAPAVSIGLASIGCILGAHGIMRKRNAGLLALVGVLETSINNYRARVADELGEEREREIYNGVRRVEVKNEETGKKEVVTQVLPGSNPYARMFTPDTSTQFDANPDYNIVMLNAQQIYANQKLHAQGHVFLNEIYDALGFAHSREGALVGWKLGNGDNYIDFGMGDIENIRTGAFIDGTEGHIYLDFNVDGIIWDKI